MERLPESISLKEFKPTTEMPVFLRDLPKVTKDLVKDIESFYFDIAQRVNWLLNNRLIIEAHTSDDTLKENESSGVHTNLGATGTITLTLPTSPTKGTHYFFGVQAAQKLRIDPGTAAIRDDSGQTDDKYKVADAIGECIHLAADENGDWETISKFGTWTEEA
jgi:hypothetical protein